MYTPVQVSQPNLRNPGLGASKEEHRRSEYRPERTSSPLNSADPLYSVDPRFPPGKVNLSSLTRDNYPDPKSAVSSRAWRGAHFIGAVPSDGRLGPGPHKG